MINLENLSAKQVDKLREDYTNYNQLVFNDDTLFNPLIETPKELENSPHLYYTYLLCQIEYIHFICDQFLNVRLLPYQCVILQELWNRKFPMLIGSRGLGKTFLLSIYVLLRCLLLRERKIVVAGAAFRQSKFIYEYACNIWNNAPLLRDSLSAYPGDKGPRGGNDSVYFYIGDSKITMIPIGTGETIRGLRANDIIVDEFKSIPKEIFENVIAGFANVESSPQKKVANRLENDFNKIMGFDVNIKRDNLDISNQIIISGTAYYYFNHFAEYWKRWHQIISSKGLPDKLAEIPGSDEEGFDWKDYSIIRIPYNLLPKGYMDAGNVARLKATLNKVLFQIECESVFSKDSDGFFKASLIESCVTNEENCIEKSSGLVNFSAKLSGDGDKMYYMGVDTASQVDNFAITILEINEDYRGIVYCWTTNSKVFKQGRKEGKIEETDFFHYCSRKIRDLMKRFNIIRIAIDSQGGGRTIYESLHNKDTIKPGEQMIWETIELDKKKDTDAEQGLHIIEMINFRKQDYTSPANHGMRKDFEDKILLFPEYNPAILAAYGNIESEYFQQMEDCIEDIEELKRELTQIVVTTTANGMERFDTPEVKISSSEKGRARKDRYSALLMANTSARTDHNFDTNYSRRKMSQLANESLNDDSVDFVGPAWLTDSLNGIYD